MSDNENGRGFAGGLAAFARTEAGGCFLVLLGISIVVCAFSVPAAIGALSGLFGS